MNDQKKVFLSATYEDSVDLIETIKSKLAECGFKVIHFKNYDFHNGDVTKHIHDVCIDKAKNAPCYLLIIDRKQGEHYAGNNTNYEGLTVTHAEFKAACAPPNNKNKKIFIFVRKNVSLYFDLWKKTPSEQRANLQLRVDQGVFELLEDIKSQGNLWIDYFEHSRELEEILARKFPRTPRNNLVKYSIKFFILFFLMMMIYKSIPNPYLCYGYNPRKISKSAIECDWTGKSYQCRFAIANSGWLVVKNPRLHLYFIDGATVSLDPYNKEWQENDNVNYFWAKDIDIPGGIRYKKMDYAERTWPIDVVFHKNGINRIKYAIISNGIAKNGELKIINKH